MLNKLKWKTADKQWCAKHNLRDVDFCVKCQDNMRKQDGPLFGKPHEFCPNKPICGIDRMCNNCIYFDFARCLLRPGTPKVGNQVCDNWRHNYA